MIILLLSLIGVVISIAVGSFWYSPATPMGRLHMRYVGFDKLSKKEQQAKIEEMKPQMFKMYGLQMLLSLLTSLAVVFIITTSLRNGVPFGMALGFIAINWLCFMVPVVGTNILWGNVDRKIAWQKFFSDILSNATTVLLVALLTDAVLTVVGTF